METLCVCFSLSESLGIMERPGILNVVDTAPSAALDSIPRKKPGGSGTLAKLSIGTAVCCCMGEGDGDRDRDDLLPCQVRLLSVRVLGGGTRMVSGTITIIGGDRLVLS